MPMRRARRSSLLVLLLLTAQAAPSGKEESARREVEKSARRQAVEADRARAAQIDLQRASTARAAEALSEENRLTGVQAGAAERLKRAEAAVNEMTAHMRELEQRRAEARSRIDKRTEALRPMLPVIVRMAAWPVETLLSVRLPSEDAVRGIAVLRTLARQAEADSRALAEDRAALEAASKEASEMAPLFAAAEAARALEAERLKRQITAVKERRESSEQDASDAARRAAAEAANAISLRSMLLTLETQRQLEEAQAREDVLRAEREQKSAAAEAARQRQAAVARPSGAGTLAVNAKPSGQLTPPATGALVRGWGDPEDGEPASGLSLQTEPGARVVAPCGGTVAFAEPFRSYGLLIIIDCGGGYHTVLSGMEQITVGPGQTVQAGDLLGAMPTAVKTASEGEPAAGEGRPEGRPVLYVELRRAGHAINPAPWLKTNP